MKSRENLKNNKLFQNGGSSRKTVGTITGII